MKLLVVLLCLLCERYVIHAVSYQRFFWFNDYYSWSVKKVTERYTNPWIILAAFVLPIVCIAALGYWLLHGLFFGLGGFIMSVLIFYYCLGPDNVFFPLAPAPDQEPGLPSLESYFSKANSQLFSVLFWYVMAGPLFVLAYRLISLSQEKELLKQQATFATQILDWIPARLTALLYLLVGNFQSGWKAFSELFAAPPQMNERLLNESGVQAARSKESEALSLPIAEQLVDQALIVLLVLIALCTLVAWL